MAVGAFMKRGECAAIRAAIAFGLPPLVVLTFLLVQPHGYAFLAAGPLSGLVGGLALALRPRSRRIWAFAIVLSLCFGLVGCMFALEDARSPLFSDVVWTAFASGFLFWTAGGCAVLALPPGLRFNAAGALAIPGAIAGAVFAFLYGPAHFLFHVESALPWEHLPLWLIAGAGGGWMMARRWASSGAETTNPHWGPASVISAVLGLGLGLSFFLRSTLPLGLFNSLSPASAAADWLWGWAAVAIALGFAGVVRPGRRAWAAAGLFVAAVLVFGSFRIEAGTWKSRFNSRYAQKMLRENGDSGDAIYAGNLILAQAALDADDVAAAKTYLLKAVETPGAQRIDQNGLDVNVMRQLFDRGEKDAVLQYLERGRTLWPKGAGIIARWQAAIRAGRRPNFVVRRPGEQGFQER